ncbi:PAS domain S-box protein [Methylobacterium sp. J-030]|uniref:HWE histidine kinase domain-containing protein n=1 Tax=Methylobacterium sp. J-030 TaxID=2836627 RepID=UPI001FBAEE0A|nr:HWE histidine kinase domain-containing protein [Methylobacterium sp. J-030]MCJ2068607.1 PAS domain S-box protein [Methylobacterium sp. J-030]
MTDLKERRRFEAEFARSDASTDPFVSAVRATRMPMLITDPSQPDNPIVFVNAAFSRLTGYAHHEIIGRNCRFLQGPSTDMADVARIGAAIARREPIEVDLLNYKKDGERFWNRLLVSPVFDRDGDLTYFFASQFDVTLEKEKLARVQADRDALEQEVALRKDELARIEERMRFALKAGRFGTWTLDLADRRLEASAICKENFGRAVGEAFSYDDLLGAIVPEDRGRMQEAVRSSIAEHGDYDIEYRVRTSAGEERWLHIRGQTFYGPDGAPQSMAGVSIDVTERKRGEEQRRLLAEELTHRVKNSMATMQSIAHQTLRNAATLDSALETLDARLASLAAAHDALTREGWGGASLGEIIEGALQPFRNGAARRFTVAGPHVWLSPRASLAFVLALHELATNAVKYGALSNDVGRVVLDWGLDEDGPPARLWLRWEEHGGPTVAKPVRSGFGSRMIERALAMELGGTASVEYRPDGVVFTLEAPVPEGTARHP